MCRYFGQALQELPCALFSTAFDPAPRNVVRSPRATFEATLVRKTEQFRKSGALACPGKRRTL